MHRSLQIILLLVCLATTALADVPRTISYQGRLTYSGIPVSGVKNVMFTIYNGGGTPVWNSGNVNVTFTDGLFTVELGQSPQPPLFAEWWASDTATSLGVTIAPNPELSPRLRFKTTPYAMHAMTAERANSGAGWLRYNGLLFLEDQEDSIGIGTMTTHAKVGISVLGNQSGLRINSSSTDLFSPALELRSQATTAAIFRVGSWYDAVASPRPAIYCVSDGGNANAGIFSSHNTSYPALIAESFGVGSAIGASAQNYCLYAQGGKGIRATADSATAIRAESYFGDYAATVISSAYIGSAVNDHIAVSGYARPADYYGVGGRFEGGFQGIVGVVYPDLSGSHAYYGVAGEASGGNGSNFGVKGYASGAGTNYGIYGAALFGAPNWAGYFDGNIRVTGSVVKSAGSVSIDHPSDPDNKFLQQSEIVSDNLKAVYDGNVTLDGSGSAVVQLPDYLESFCGEFRYQLTCIGGYAPVYVASKVANSRFTIAGGSPGLEVSWQITGIRKDKYALANPLEVEKKKTVSEQGKYLHPELYGFSDDRSLSPNPDRDPSVKAKNDAIREASAALAKPSTPPKQPVMMEKK